jgi:ABC-type sugar transport system substrate-binding protein
MTVRVAAASAAAAAAAAAAAVSALSLRIYRPNSPWFLPAKKKREKKKMNERKHNQNTG